EKAAAPQLPQERRQVLGRDDQTSDTQVDVMTEEQLLRGMESLTPTEPSANGGSGAGRGWHAGGTRSGPPRRRSTQRESGYAGRRRSPRPWHDASVRACRARS